MTEDGEVKPTRKGVTLNRNEWENLIAALSEISAVLPEMALYVLTSNSSSYPGAKEFQSVPTTNM